MKFPNALAALLLLTTFSCSKNSTTSEVVDSSALAVAQDTLIQTEDTVSYAQPVEGLQGVDTLFNFLAKQKLLQGELQSAEVITTSFIDPKTPSRDGLI